MFHIYLPMLKLTAPFARPTRYDHLAAGEELHAIAPPRVQVAKKALVLAASKKELNRRSHAGFVPDVAGVRFASKFYNSKILKCRRSWTELATGVRPDGKGGLRVAHGLVNIGQSAQSARATAAPDTRLRKSRKRAT